MAADRFAPAASRLAGLAGVLLGWSPEAFWRATPTELRAVLEALCEPAGGAAVGRDELAGLMAKFPD
ncbi:MAG TPA: phage tail assembly chaperone [Allosphingosinicella sp.]|jgi:uncharacterized phage protein (TIGR02216 family)